MTSKKLAAKKLAVKNKPIIVDSSSKESDGYLSSTESDGYSSSKESDAKLLGPPQANRGLSDYKQLREQRVAWNNARLAKLGLIGGEKPKEAKTKVIKQRKSSPEYAPRRELPDRKRKAKSYNEDEY